MWKLSLETQRTFSSPKKRQTPETPKSNPLPIELSRKGIISDCNAMNYTQIAFEINFYFFKSNMLWILGVTIVISSNSNQPLFIHSQFAVLLSALFWGWVRITVVGRQGMCRSRKIKIWKMAKTNKHFSVAVLCGERSQRGNFRGFIWVYINNIWWGSFVFSIWSLSIFREGLKRSFFHLKHSLPGWHFQMILKESRHIKKG